MEQLCRHCKEVKECTEVGKYSLCGEHKHLKQYQPKIKKTYSLKKSPLKKSAGKINKISKKESLNIRAKHKAYNKLAELIPHACSGCGTTSNLTHSHLVPVGQNKSLEAVISNITYHCVDCHHIWEHDIENRKYLNDYDINMEKISVLDPQYFNLITSKEF